jgi:hypothetical protein
MIRKAVEFLILHAVIIIPVVLAILLAVSSTVRTAARFLLRLIARPLLLLAVVALVYDGTRTLAGGSGLAITPLVEHWNVLAPRSLAGFQAFIGRLVSPAAWDGVVLRVVMLPAWLIVGVLGFALAWLGRKPQRTRVFIN